MYFWWLIFSSYALCWYPIVHFLSMWLSGIIAVVNRNSHCASPWKIPLWIFGSVKLLPPGDINTLQVFMVYDFMWYFVHFEANYNPALGNNIICLFVINPGHCQFFSVWSRSRLGCVDLFKVTLLCLRIIWIILSVFQGAIHGSVVSIKSPSLFVLLIFSPSSVSGYGSVVD